MGIAIDFVGISLGLGLLALFWAMRAWRQSYEDPHILFPTLQGIPQSSRYSALANSPFPFFLVAFASFLSAFIDPHTMSESAGNGDKAVKIPREGVAIYFLLDQSGSMREEVPVSYSLDSRRELPKIDLMKRVTTRFIAGDRESSIPGLEGDLVGVVSFARGARVLAPLTLDHETVLQDIAAIQPMNSAETDGTAIGYAIYKTASMIAATRHFGQEMQTNGQAPYQIKGSAIVVVTDGLQSPNPLDKGKRLRNMDIPEAAAYAKEQDIRLYIINIDPRITMEEFAPHRHIMQRAAESTGGKFMAVSGDAPLSVVYGEIAQMEKGSLFNTGEAVQSSVRRSFSLYPWLVALGMASLLVAVFLQTVAYRRVP